MKRAVHPLLLTLIAIAQGTPWVLAAGQIAVVQSSDAGKPSEANKAPVVKLVLHPAAEPRPALKYQLLPPIMDRRPGNAAVLYGKVTAEQLPFFGNQEQWEKIVKWIDTPLAEFPREEARKVLGGVRFQDLDRAARCEYCDWQLPLRDEPFYEILLPNFNRPAPSAGYWPPRRGWRLPRAGLTRRCTRFRPATPWRGTPVRDRR
jgi:hypothetical protein